MDDYGRQPSGIELDAEDQQCTLHPELWLAPSAIEEISKEEKEKELEALRKKEAAAAKKARQELVQRGVFSKSLLSAVEAAAK